MSRSPFWPPSEPPLPDSELAQGQVQIIADDQQVGQLELVEPQGLADGPAAEVHERLGLQEQDAAEVDLGLGDQAVELAAENDGRDPPGPGGR